MSALYKILSAVLSFVSAPLLLHCLGDEKYGIWATILSFISWIYYCDLGIGNGLRNKLASTIVIGDKEASKKYLGTAYVLITGISLGVFVFIFVFYSIFDIGNWLEIELSGENIQVCLIAAMFFACVNFVMSLVNNILFAMQKASCVNFFSCISQLLFVILLVFYSITGVNTILLFAIGEGLSQLIKNIIETLFVFKKYPELKFSLKDYDKNYTSGILSFGLQMFIVQIAALVLNSTDNILITKILGAAEVTPYNFCYKYFNMIQTLYVALIMPLLSAYTAAYTLKDTQWIYKSLKKNILLLGIFSVGSIIAAVIFKPFTVVWLQKNIYFEPILIVCTLIYFILLMFSHVFSTFLTGISCIKETTIATVIGTILNIPASVFLAKNIGLGTSGVVLGSAVSLSCTVMIGPYITLREIKKLRGEV